MIRPVYWTIALVSFRYRVRETSPETRGRKTSQTRKVRKMAKRSKKKQYQINDAVSLDYWNADEWEFAIDHTVIEEQTANKYETLVMMLVMRFAPQGIPQERLDAFIGMCQEVFAL